MNTRDNYWADGQGQTPAWARPYPTHDAGQSGAQGSAAGSAGAGWNQNPYAAGPNQGPFATSSARVVTGRKDRTLAGILAILLGGLGIHKFYMGYTHAGLLMLLLSVFTFGWLGTLMHVIGIIEGVIYLTMPDAQFQETYIRGDKKWF